MEDSRALSLEGAGLRRLCGLKILRESSRKGTSLEPQRSALENDRYDFYHNRIREAIKAEIPEPRTRILHRRLAETIAQLRPDDSESLVRELLLAGEEARAAAHAEGAAESALRKLAHARAVDLYQLALRHCEDPAKAAYLRLRLAHSLEGSGRFRDAIEHYREGLAAANLSEHDVLWNKMHLANCLMVDGDLEASSALVAEGLAALGHVPERPRLLRALTVFGSCYARSSAAGSRSRRAPSTIRRRSAPVRLLDGDPALPVHLAQSRAARVRAALSPARCALALARGAAGSRGDLAHPAAAVRAPRRRASSVASTPTSRSSRTARPASPAIAARMWLPLLRALYEVVSGRPDKSIPWWEEFHEVRIAKSGYIALQRQNALFLAGEYDKFVGDVSRAAAHRAEALTPLDIVRLAYIERLRGDKETAWRLLADVENVDPQDLPWTHRSLFTYQLVEMKLLDGDTEAAARLARTMLVRIRRSALSPTTGAFECADGVTRAFLAEANRLARVGQRDAARALVKEAERALKQTPALEPPLFAARMLHDRAVVALALGRRDEGLALLAQAEAESRHGAIPCARMRLLEDLLDVLAPSDPRRNAIFAEANEMSAARKFTPRRWRAPWLFPLDT